MAPKKKVMVEPDVNVPGIIKLFIINFKMEIQMLEDKFLKLIVLLVMQWMYIKINN